MKHAGINTHRLPYNNKERALAEAWEKEAPKTLPILLDGTHDNYRSDDFSERDAEVAATVIQWLGTHVGRSFLASVQSSELYQTLDH
jgi:hypothetical protein